jgi:hypothetical protein
MRICLALTILLSLPGVTEAQDNRFDIEVLPQLFDYAKFADGMGFGAPTVHRGLLSDGKQEELKLTLARNSDFLIIGRCDDECNALALSLHDGGGEVVDRFPGTNSIARVQVTTKNDEAIYRLRVTMADCGSDPCAFGIAVFRREARGRTEATPSSPSEAAIQIAPRSPDIVANDAQRTKDQPLGEPPDANTKGGDSSSVIRQFDDWTNAVEKMGRHQTPPQVLNGRTSKGKVAEHTVRVSKNSDYFVIARCDDSCDAMNLTIVAPDGRLLGALAAEYAPQEASKLPYASLRSTKEGDYLIRVEITECAEVDCAYGIALYRRK